MKNLFKLNWINGLGLSFIFTGFLYFLKIAADAGWLPPELRSAFGLLAGASGIYLGIQLFKKNKTTWGESIAGLGTAMLYATLAYISFSSTFSFSANALLISMLSIGITTAYLAVKSNMRIFTLLATLGGLIVPLVVKAPENQDFTLFIYLLIINAGSILLSTFKKWQELKVVSFVLTLAIYSSYYVLFDPMQWQKPMGYITCFFLVYFVGIAYSTFKISEKEALTDGYLGILNAISFVFWSTLILNDFNVSHLLPLGAVSLLYLGIGYVFYRFDNKSFNLVNGSYLIIGGLCLAVVSSNSGMVLENGFHYVVNTAVWLLIIVSAHFVGQRLGNAFMSLMSYFALFFLSIYWYAFAWEVEWVALFGIKYLPFLNAGALIWMGMAFAGFYFSKHEEKKTIQDDSKVQVFPRFDSKIVAAALGCLSHVIVGGLLTVQISNLWKAYDLIFISKGLVLSVTWIIYALGIYSWSVFSKNKGYKILGSVVLMLTSLKIFIWDLAGSATYQKVIFLMICGALTLLIGKVNRLNKHQNPLEE